MQHGECMRRRRNGEPKLRPGRKKKIIDAVAILDRKKQQVMLAVQTLRDKQRAMQRNDKLLAGTSASSLTTKAADIDGCHTRKRMETATVLNHGTDDEVPSMYGTKAWTNAKRNAGGKLRAREFD